MTINNQNDAYNIMKNLGAPKRLIQHSELVKEAAEELISGLYDLSEKIDFEFVRIGVILHDIGKIKYKEEIYSNEGNFHAIEGEKILLKIGISKKIARCCVSHNNYNNMKCSIEELLIALSDKLWKGKRDKELELKVIDELACLYEKTRWDIYI